MNTHTNASFTSTPALLQCIEHSSILKSIRDDFQGTKVKLKTVSDETCIYVVARNKKRKVVHSIYAQKVNNMTYRLVVKNNDHQGVTRSAADLLIPAEEIEDYLNIQAAWIYRKFIAA